MKQPPDIIEGTEAWDRFRKATKAILTVKKTDMPPSPFAQHNKKKKPASRKAN